MGKPVGPSLMVARSPFPSPATPIRLTKAWYRAHELPPLTGIPRGFWRPYKKAGGIWIWRKQGTHPSAPVYLHVESIANELDSRGLPYRVNIGGREVDPGMEAYVHRDRAVSRPTNCFQRPASTTHIPVGDNPIHAEAAATLVREALGIAEDLVSKLQAPGSAADRMAASLEVQSPDLPLRAAERLRAHLLSIAGLLDAVPAYQVAPPIQGGGGR